MSPPQPELGSAEIGLLAKMVEADDTASRDGYRDAVFAIIRLSGGATYLDHRGLGGQRPAISRRAVIGLQEAGLFHIVSDTANLLRVYLAPSARESLERTRVAKRTVDDVPDVEVRHLIEVIFERFHKTGEWPLVEALRHELLIADDELDVPLVGRRLDAALGRVDDMYQGRASLTIHGVASCAGVEEDLNDALVPHAATSGSE